MKIRISDKDKNSIFALLAISTVIIMFVVMFFPEIIPYEYSMVHLSEKKDNIETVVANITSNERLVDRLKDDISQKLNEISLIEEEVRELGSLVSVDKFDIHIPSLLVTLEVAANTRNLKFTILYDQFEMNSKYDPNSNLAENIKIEELDDNTDKVTVEKEIEQEQFIEDENQQNRDPSNIFNRDNNNEDRDRNEYEYEDDNGIKYATIPMVIEGDFLEVRDFIRSLDEFDFVEAATIDIASDSEIIKAAILLKIYYGEGVM